MTWKQGMIKMYNAEVLSKFPVIQHFPFGSLFSWEQDPSAAEPAHAADQQRSHSVNSNAATISRTQQENTRAPWANQRSAVPTRTAAPNSAVNDRLSYDKVLREPETSRFPEQSSQGPRTANLSQPAKVPEVATKAPWAARGGE